MRMVRRSLVSRLCHCPGNIRFAPVSLMRTSLIRNDTNAPRSYRFKLPSTPHSLGVRPKHSVELVKTHRAAVLLFPRIVAPSVFKLLEKPCDSNRTEFLRQNCDSCRSQITRTVDVNIHHIQSPLPDRIQDSSHEREAKSPTGTNEPRIRCQKHISTSHLST